MTAQARPNIAASHGREGAHRVYLPDAVRAVGRESMADRPAGPDGELSSTIAQHAADEAQLSITRVASTLFLRGALDAYTRHLLADAGAELLASYEAESASRLQGTSTHDGRGVSKPQRAVVDMAGLEFIDAGGLGELVTLRANLAAVGVVLRMTRATARVRRVITLCQLDVRLGLESPNPAAGLAEPGDGSLRAP